MEVQSEEQRREKNGGFLYPSDSPWAIFEGNYKGAINWVEELMKGRHAPTVLKTEEDVASNTALSAAPMQRRKHTNVYSAPTPWTSTKAAATETEKA